MLPRQQDISITENLQLARFLRFNFKVSMIHLLQLHAQLDAWYGMAMAVKHYKLVFPEFVRTEEPIVKAKGLFHVT